jgi:hypothetical protein
MRKFFRILISLILVIMIIGEIGYYTSKLIYEKTRPGDWDSVTTVGEIVRVKSAWSDYEPWAGWCIYVRPVGSGNNQELLLFTVNAETDTESPFSMNLEDMPELAVGEIVEIAHTYKMLTASDRHPDDNRSVYVRGYQTYSIKRANGTFNERQRILRLADVDWGRIRDSRPLGELVTVDHVSKISYPANGYIVYAHGYRGAGAVLQCYWVGLGASVSREMREALESGETGYKIIVAAHYQYMFENLEAKICDYMELESKGDTSRLPEQYTELHDNYRVIHFNRYNGGSSTRYDRDDFGYSDIYYYIKIEHGKLKVTYWQSMVGTNLMCSASEEEVAKSGSVDPGSSTFIYISIKCTDAPVTGVLIISFVPLDEIDYDFEE